MSAIEKEKKETESNQLLNKDKKSLYLVNDNINQFDYVVETLIAVCEHDPYQAEQCTFVTHYKGKCEIKRDAIENLKAFQSQLSERGLLTLIN